MKAELLSPLSSLLYPLSSILSPLSYFLDHTSLIGSPRLLFPE
jgi:hypothetical protein